MEILCRKMFWLGKGSTLSLLYPDGNVKKMYYILNSFTSFYSSEKRQKFISGKVQALLYFSKFVCGE
jgi:hypothetical protein